MFLSNFQGKMKMKMILIIGFVLVGMSIVEGGRRHVGERTLSSSSSSSSSKVTKNTKATLTVNGFDKNEDGGGASECDEKYHRDTEMIVALSSGWYDGGNRCHKYIKITNPKNKKSVKAMVVDECDTSSGCDNNIVDASHAVWKALGVNDNDIGEMSITWSDA